ncbi:CynX/NimT family MFS transporter [Paremcibacter congregatus]|uniref:MFS transporter n=1 Tax=Paremcibacter congregatus TaxID=2043170 RepID=UPI0030EBBAC1|tara:strand:- start:5975 stop:7174 length:1200 start_codon:yes stop_codon:yes gene_type:complete
MNKISAHTNWAAVGFLFCLGMVASAQIFKLAPALPYLRSELNLSLVAGGLLFSIINMTPALIGVGAGSLADHVGFRRSLLFGLLGLAVSGLFGSLSHTVEFILLFRFFEGVSILAVVITAPAMISSITAPHQRHIALSLWSSYMPMGAALTLLMAPYLLDQMGWRTLWQISAGIAFLMAGIMYFFLHTPKIATHSKTVSGLFRRLGDVLSKPVPWLLTMPFLFFTALQGPILAWLPSFLMEQRGLSAMMAGVLTAGIILSNVGGVMMGGILLARGIPHWRLICISGILIFFGSIGLFNEHLPDIIRYGCCILTIGLTGMLPTAALSSVPQFAPTENHVGTLNGMLIQGSQTGHFVGPPLYALIVHRAGGDWGSALGLYLVFALLIFFCGLLLRRYATSG